MTQEIYLCLLYCIKFRINSIGKTGAKSPTTDNSKKFYVLLHYHILFYTTSISTQDHHP